MDTTRTSPPRDRVTEAIEAGQLWRAKEILQGRLRGRAFDPELYERLGMVLLRMGDDVEAGKYLLLSGARQPEYERAIRLFLDRYARGPWEHMVAAFPASARRCLLSELPLHAREDLERAGVPGYARLADRPSDTAAPVIGMRGWLMIVLALVAIGFILAVLIVHFDFGV